MVGIFGIELVFESATKPSIVDKVVLGIANPRRSKNLSLVFGSNGLFFTCFGCTRLNDFAVFFGDKML